MTELQDMSPYGVFARHCAQGELAFQVDTDNRAVFYPRMCAPGHGGPLSWRVSSGLGTVHATTVVHPRDGNPYNVALVDLDEGFRMMSRVEEIDPSAVTIGTRVQARFVSDGDIADLPVFVPVVES